MEFCLARKKFGEQTPYNRLSLPRLPGAGLPGQGVVIISEFVSSARVMRGALAVNPWKVEEVGGVNLFLFSLLLLCVVSSFGAMISYHSVVIQLFISFSGHGRAVSLAGDGGLGAGRQTPQESR
jgi:hypothetical protein